MEQSISVNAVLDEIKAEIAKNQESCDFGSFDDFWLEKHNAADRSFERTAFLSEVTSLECFHTLQYYRELTVARGGVVGKLKGVVFAFKRTIRKLIKFAVFPLVNDQNIINENIMRILRHVRVFVNSEAQYAERLCALEKKVYRQEAAAEQELSLAALSEQLTQLQTENEALRARLETLEAKNRA